MGRLTSTEDNVAATARCPSDLPHHGDAGGDGGGDGGEEEPLQPG